MRIALFERSDAACFPGGDTVQMQAIKNYLVEGGVEVVSFGELMVDLTGFEQALVFNLTQPLEAYLQALCCKSQGVPFIVFPIYWKLEKAIP